ncbi:MAG: glycosyltransferase family 2 protein [Parachlamydiaceae bacterium]
MKAIKKLASYVLKISIVVITLVRLIIFLLKGLVRRSFFHRCKKLLLWTYTSIYQFQKALKDYEEHQVDDFFFHTHYNQRASKKIKCLASGLHSLLPGKEQFFYSLILPVGKTTLQHFKSLLQSLADQSALHKEVLIGFSEESSALRKVLSSFQRNYPGLFRDYSLPGLNKAEITNQLTKLAKGNYFLLLDDAVLIRPDLLYRYEQTIRLQKEKSLLMMYGKEIKLNKYEHVDGLTESTKLETLHFPYLFVNFFHGSILVTKELWDNLKGYNENYHDAALYDLILRAEQGNASIIRVPVLLSVLRERSISADQQVKETQTAIKVLENYAALRNLSWKVAPGYFFGSLRVEPELSKTPFVHVIIPYKNQKKLTLSSIRHTLRQKGVKLAITAIDNRSDDDSIAEEIRALGCEVISIDEPFNYSRLNNLALERSAIGKDCEYVLFLNNDVDLLDNAVYEMCLWVDQPSIGTVGCRLHYPDGLLQCGGVDVNPEWPRRFTGWDVFEKKLPFEQLNIQRLLRISDGVNGACLLMRKDLFLKIKGFDEIWYPIAHSDTNLSAKVKSIGLLNFYTPFASGTHHETVTREVSFMEDYENSAWLDAHYFNATSLIEA